MTFCMGLHCAEHTDRVWPKAKDIWSDAETDKIDHKENR